MSSTRSDGSPRIPIGVPGSTGVPGSIRVFRSTPGRPASTLNSSSWVST